jgi:ribosomal protein S18 acetylase RimI-like enzyme
MNPEGVVVRSGSKNDLDILCRLERQIFSGRDELFSRAQLRYLLSSSTSEVLIVSLGGAPIGYSIALFQRLRNGKLRGRIYTLGILPELQNKDYGTLLLKETEIRLSSHHVDFVTLETRSDSLGARGFFEESGYRTIGKLAGYYEDSDGIRMRKDRDK